MLLELVPDKYMVIEYDEPIRGQASKTKGRNIESLLILSESVQKNSSSSGFYITLKLDTDLKEGQKFKADEIYSL